MALILFVVGLHLRPLPNIFFIDRVTDEAIDHDNDRLIHFIARHHARERFAFASLFRWHIQKFPPKFPHPLGMGSPTSPLLRWEVRKIFISLYPEPFPSGSSSPVQCPGSPEGSGS